MLRERILQIYDLRGWGGTVLSDGVSSRVELNDIGGKKMKAPSNHHLKTHGSL